MTGVRRSVDRGIRGLAERQHGVVTRRQLLDLGMRPAAVDRRIRGGSLRPLHRGVFLVGPLTTPLTMDMAAVLATGAGAVLSHVSAACLWEMVPRPVDGGVGGARGPEASSETDAQWASYGTHGKQAPSGTRRSGGWDAPLHATVSVDVIIPGGDRGRRPGVRVHRVIPVMPDERTYRSGIPITTPPRTLFDLAGVLSPGALERALARGERADLVDRTSLERLIPRHAGRPGLAALRTLVRLKSDPALTRSEAEARFLAMIRRARLPVPETNVVVSGHEVDFFWRTRRLAVEVDGYRFHASRHMFEKDRRRDAHLAAGGVHVLRLTWRQIVWEELATAVLLGQALSRARWG